MNKKIIFVEIPDFPLDPVAEGIIVDADEE